MIIWPNYQRCETWKQWVRNSCRFYTPVNNRSCWVIVSCPWLGFIHDVLMMYNFVKQGIYGAHWFSAHSWLCKLCLLYVSSWSFVFEQMYYIKEKKLVASFEFQIAARRNYKWCNKTWWGTRVCRSLCNRLGRCSGCDSQYKTAWRKYVSSGEISPWISVVANSFLLSFKIFFSKRVCLGLLPAPVGYSSSTVPDPTAAANKHTAVHYAMLLLTDCTCLGCCG